jgi:hypothetical protein
VGGDSYYDILGLRPDASPQEVRSKYRSLIRRIHPDLDGPVALFRQVQEAYEVLSDPRRRAEYDRRLAARRSEARAAANQSPSGTNAGPRSSSAQNGRRRDTYTPRARSVPQNRGPVFRSFPSQNPAGAVALAGAVLVVIAAALGHSGWIIFGFGCLAIGLGVLAGVGRYGTRTLEAFQRSGMGAIDMMSSREFEALLGDLFVRKGYRVARLGVRGEGRANLLLEHPGGPTVVQVKRWTATVNQDAVQQAAAARERFRATGVLVVTSSTYSPSAVSFAHSCGVTLWNRSTLAAELAVLQRERRSTGGQRLASDLRTGYRVCLGLWVSALVMFTMSSRRVFRRRPTARK